MTSIDELLSDGHYRAVQRMNDGDNLSLEFELQQAAEPLP